MASSKRISLAGAVALGLVLLSGPAHADDPTTLGAARQLGIEGLALYKSARFAEALDKFVAADNLVPAHTLGLGAARCFAGLGRLVEASEKYLDVQRRPLDKGALPAQRQALKDALFEREKLLPRIPQLILHVRGERLSEVDVKLDGKPFPRALVDQKTPMDPGPHKLVLERGSAVVQKVIRLDEGKTQEVTVSAPALPDAAPAQSRGASGLEIGGWLATSIGVAGVVTFGVAGAAGLAQQGTLSARCPAGVCPPDQWGAVDAYDASRVASVVGLVAGGVGLAIGIPMLVVHGSQKPAAKPSASVGVGARGAQLAVQF